jgi:WD40 repeat protein
VLTSGRQAAKLYEIESGRELLSLKGHAGWVSAAAFSRDGAALMTGGNDGTARVWQADPWR